MVDKEELQRLYESDREKHYAKWYYFNHIKPDATLSDWVAWRDGLYSLYQQLGEVQ